MTPRGHRWWAPALAVAALLIAPAAAPADPVRCDPLGEGACLLPWPNDFLTRTDRSSATGRRLDLQAAQMPRNVDGTPIAPGDYDASDGFSPGQTIVVKVPGLDTPEAFARTGAVPQTDLARTYDRRQPVVVIDTRTLRRQLIWAELDATADTPADTALLVHPAVNFREAHRYVVALRRLRDATGRMLPAPPAFRVYRDRLKTASAVLKSRRRHMERVFRTLRRAGIDRDELYLAWDFTVASERSLSERMLSIRDRAFATLGDGDLADLRPAGAAPPYVIDSVTDYTPAEQPHVARRIEGRVTVPCFLDRPGCPPGSRFRLGPDGLPLRTVGNTTQARFICNVPRSATPDAPARPSLYGHGLFGDAGEVRADNVEQLGDEQDVLVCGSDWIGMAEEDIPNALQALQDLSRFPTLPDRLQQGFVNWMFVGRALIHPQGLSANPAFRRDGRALVDTRRLFYYGNSQGGIAGGALTALTPDFTRSVLYVGAMNYSLLVQRSVDFDPFGAVLDARYPDPLQRPLIISLLQVLWDRGEPNGYAWHMTDDAYPNTPRHAVLQLESFGDHQVANVATEVEARTIGSHVRLPALDPGPQHRRPPAVRHPTAAARRHGPRCDPRPVGHRAAAPARPGHAAAAGGQPAAAHRRGPARSGDRIRGAGTPPDSRLAADRRALRRGLRRRPLPRGGLAGAGRVLTRERAPIGARSRRSTDVSLPSGGWSGAGRSGA